VGDQLTLGVRLRDHSVFESYYAGRNRPVIDALRASMTGQGATCIWLQGPRAVGKSHLLQAICAAAGVVGAPAAYLPLEDGSLFPERLVGLGELSCVCIDDMERIQGQAAWERAVFSLYRELDERRHRLFVASNAAPGVLDLALRDLGSRLNGSLVLTLQTLDDDEQVRALQLRAHRRGFELPEDSAQYLLRRLPRDMAHLCKFLDDLDEASLVAQRRLTVPFVKSVIEKSTIGS
jgi:DnaA-homolog protein